MFLGKDGEHGTEYREAQCRHLLIEETSSRLLWSGLRKLMKAKPLRAQCLKATGTPIARKCQENMLTSDREGELTHLVPSILQVRISIERHETKQNHW